MDKREVRDVSLDSRSRMVSTVGAVAATMDDLMVAEDTPEFVAASDFADIDGPAERLVDAGDFSGREKNQDLDGLEGVVSCVPLGVLGSIGRSIEDGVLLAVAKPDMRLWLRTLSSFFLARRCPTSSRLGSSQFTSHMVKLVVVVVVAEAMLLELASRQWTRKPERDTEGRVVNAMQVCMRQG